MLHDLQLDITLLNLINKNVINIVVTSSSRISKYVYFILIKTRKGIKEM